MPEYTKETVTLRGGGDKAMPIVGLGTWQSGPNEVAHAVEAALKAGYRHIDTAAAYGNEDEVGQGIKASGVPRDEIWITTKLNNPDHKDVLGALKKSIDLLDKGGYIDLYLMHWPCSTDPDSADPSQDGKLAAHYPDWDYVKTWQEMLKLPKDLVKHIGVSNFGIHHLKKLYEAVGEDDSKMPEVNQIELHPGWQTPELVAMNKQHGIHTTGYSCLGSQGSPLYKSESLKKLAEAKGKTPQQVVLMWGLQNGWSIIPKSVSPKRIEGNFELNGWSLTDEEMATVSELKQDWFKVCDGTFLPDDQDGTPMWHKVFPEFKAMLEASGRKVGE